MTLQALDNMRAIKDIRARMQAGDITYEQAKAEAEPVIKRINKRNAEIAKKHKMRPKNINFAGLMR
jgi:polyhydroxyalkanoate synthesis regulator phasin